MKFKQVAGTSIVPTLSRLVLAVAFLTAGYSKLFVSVPYSAAQVEALDGLGVTVTPIGGEEEEAVATRSGARIVLASLIQEEPAPEPEPEPEPPADEEEPKPEEPADEPAPTEPADEPAPAPAAEDPPVDPTLDPDESELLESLKASVREAADEAKRKADALAERKAARENAEPAVKRLTPKSPPPVELGNDDEPQPETRPADDAPSEPDTPDAPDDDGADADTPTEPDGGDTAESTPAADATDAPAGTAKALHKITLMVHNDERLGTLPPAVVASSGQVAAWTEFIGGALLLVGFLSRVWGLGLAFAMGVAFYLTSFEAYWCEVGPFALASDLGANLGLFNRMFAQLGLGVLAFGVFLTGPGPLSLDRFLFGRRGGKGASVIVDEDE